MDEERKRLLRIVAEHGRLKTVAHARYREAQTIANGKAINFHMIQERLWRDKLEDYDMALARAAKSKDNANVDKTEEV